MASWFGGNLGNSLEGIRNQVSSSLKEVFEEEDEPTDPLAVIAVTKDKLDVKEKLVQDLKDEVEKLKERNQELLEEKEVFFLQCRGFMTYWYPSCSGHAWPSGNSRGNCFKEKLLMSASSWVLKSFCNLDEEKKMFIE